MAEDSGRHSVRLSSDNALGNSVLEEEQAKIIQDLTTILNGQYSPNYGVGGGEVYWPDIRRKHTELVFKVRLFDLQANVVSLLTETNDKAIRTLTDFIAKQTTEIGEFQVEFDAADNQPAKIYWQRQIDKAKNVLQHKEADLYKYNADDVQFIHNRVQTDAELMEILESLLDATTKNFDDISIYKGLIRIVLWQQITYEHKDNQERLQLLKFIRANLPLASTPDDPAVTAKEREHLKMGGAVDGISSGGGGAASGGGGDEVDVRAMTTKFNMLTMDTTVDFTNDRGGYERRRRIFSPQSFVHAVLLMQNPSLATTADPGKLFELRQSVVGLLYVLIAGSTTVLQSSMVPMVESLLR